MPMSLTALREIFRDVTPSKLPQDLADCLAGDKLAIEANHAAYREWERCREEEQVAAHFTTALGLPATVDPEIPQFPLSVLLWQPTIPALQQPTPSPSQIVPPAMDLASSFQIVPHAAPSSSLPQSTSHTDSACPTLLCTESRNVRGTCNDPDPALHLCPSNTPPTHRHENGSNWEPHVLFPELASQPFSSVPRPAPLTLNASNANPNNEIDAPREIPKPQQPR